MADDDIVPMPDITVVTVVDNGDDIEVDHDEDVDPYRAVGLLLVALVSYVQGLTALADDDNDDDG